MTETKMQFEKEQKKKEDRFRADEGAAILWELWY